jgi:dsDNA-binding SOS-regulon protein
VGVPADANAAGAWSKMTEETNELTELILRATEAVKRAQWDDAEHLLNALVQKAQALRLAIRDKRLPLAAPNVLKGDEEG